jgi:hypothetical protein
MYYPKGEHLSPFEFDKIKKLCYMSSSYVCHLCYSQKPCETSKTNMKDEVIMWEKPFSK